MNKNIFYFYPISSLKGVSHRQRTTEYSKEHNGITKFFLKDLIKESSLKNSDTVSDNKTENKEKHTKQNDKNPSFNVSYTWETDSISGLRYINVLNKKDKKKLGFQCIYCRDKQLFKKKNSVLYHMVTFNHGLKSSVVEELKLNERTSDDRLNFINNFDVKKRIEKEKEKEEKEKKVNLKIKQQETQKESFNDYSLIKLEIEFVSTLYLLTYEELEALYFFFFSENLFPLNDKYMNKENIIEKFLTSISSISNKYSTYNVPNLKNDVQYITLSEYLNELKDSFEKDNNLKHNPDVVDEVGTTEMSIKNDKEHEEEKEKEKKDEQNEKERKKVEEVEADVEVGNTKKEDTNEGQKHDPEKGNASTMIYNTVEKNKEYVLEKEIEQSHERNKENIQQERETAIKHNGGGVVKNNEMDSVGKKKKKRKKERDMDIETLDGKDHILINLNDCDIIKHNDKLFINLTAQKETKDDKRNKEKKTFLIINNKEVNNVQVSMSSSEEVLYENINNNESIIPIKENKENSRNILLNMNKVIRKTAKRNAENKKSTTNACKMPRSIGTNFKPENIELSENSKINDLGKRSSLGTNLMEKQETGISALSCSNTTHEGTSVNVSKQSVGQGKPSTYTDKLIEENMDMANNANKEKKVINCNEIKYSRENQNKCYNIIDEQQLGNHPNNPFTVMNTKDNRNIAGKRKKKNTSDDSNIEINQMSIDDCKKNDTATMDNDAKKIKLCSKNISKFVFFDDVNCEAREEEKKEEDERKDTGKDTGADKSDNTGESTLRDTDQNMDIDGADKKKDHKKERGKATIRRRNNCIPRTNEINKNKRIMNKIERENKFIRKKEKYKAQQHCSSLIHERIVKRNPFMNSAGNNKTSSNNKNYSIKGKSQTNKKTCIKNIYEQGIGIFEGDSENILHGKKFIDKSERKKSENRCTFLKKEIKQLCNLSNDNIIQYNDINLSCTRSHRISRYTKI
ncbi:conserved Plasmodium protein, unknown function [Plasmodium malariae]|uniref:Uncharacterized protein n=1 Tax=Plasmodium malariae TaxID=5858 RepID=A0A1D3TF45_PLAMA|nr:conserved Plasmodium protein, unknown function [Plasmodium malariae]SCP03593.1 conserved Plasmodium protein, unknown function [Plasmodium malariae]